jgi:hypothetical protein
LVVSTAGADTISRPEAQRRIASAETAEDGFLASLPALRPVDQVVRNDCAAKVTGHTATDSFCICAAAVTVSLWRSGIDPRMVDRLSAFVNGSGALTASDFVKFEGPELYRPLCELGSYP